MKRSILVFLLLLTACASKEFRTKAIYEAPNSGYRLEVIGFGTIDRQIELAYLGEYDATFSPLISGDTVRFRFRYPDKTNPDYHILTLEGEYGSQSYEEYYIEDIIEHVLAAAGYTTFHEGEFEETIFAIYAISSGPQATVKEEDAKFLKVVDVQYNYKGE
jgi:hypothetical protein